MNKKEFEELIIKALEMFPDYFKQKMENVAIVVQDEPDIFQKKHLGYCAGNCILGLYEGIPRIRRQNYNGAAPDKITFFQNNIEKISNNDVEVVKKLIKEILWHEIGHHFGMTEEEIQKQMQKQQH